MRNKTQRYSIGSNKISPSFWFLSDYAKLLKMNLRNVQNLKTPAYEVSILRNRARIMLFIVE